MILSHINLSPCFKSSFTVLPITLSHKFTEIPSPGRNAIRSSSKIRGDNPQDTTFVHIYYETFEDMMHDIVLTAQQPDIFDSTYGQINQDANSNNAIFGNNKPMPEAGSAGQTVAYAFVEITLHFLPNNERFDAASKPLS